MMRGGRAARILGESRGGLPVTTSSQRAAAVMLAVRASATGDSGAIAELFTDDVEGWSPAMRVSSAAELAIELEDRDDAFSDVELTFSPLDAEDDRACVEWTMTATHTGPLVISDERELEPTGVRVTMHGVTVAEFDGDRICSFRQYWDGAELLAQIVSHPSVWRR
jgi:hypothetical protein